MKTSYLIAAVGAALLTIYLIQRFFFGDIEDPEMLLDPIAEVVQTEAAPFVPDFKEPVTEVVPEPEALPAVVVPPLPELNDSDSLLQDWGASFEFPSLWLEQEHLIRRFASLLEGAASGSYPKRQLEFLLPADDFLVYQRGKNTYLDTASYQRYNYLPELLESVPVSSMAAYFRRVRPLIVEALGELGQREAPETLLAQVVAQLNAVPLLDQPIELARPSVLYRFREDELEQRTSIEKLFLRMGPANIKRLRRYANALVPVLGEPEPVTAG